MNEIEVEIGAAVEVLKQSAYKDDWTTEEVVVEMFQAGFVARVGCEQCGGTGKTLLKSDRQDDWTEQIQGVIDARLTSIDDCPAVHVELPNPYGGTVWADPNKVEWRCWQEFGSIDCQPEFLVVQGHDACRYVPKPLEVTDDE